MRVLWQGLKVTGGLFLAAGLVFSGGLFAVLLYAKLIEHDVFLGFPKSGKVEVQVAPITPVETTTKMSTPEPAATKPKPKPSAMIDAPLVLQNPELPSGCEVTSLTMMLQFIGVNKSKLELAAEMQRDETPITWSKEGTIAYWGHPNTGFVGEITGKARGFGIYHQALFPLLKKYVPTAVDLTGKSFTDIEHQISDGIPVVVWTTIDFAVPAEWISWNTPIGAIQTTFMEHAVLLVGYDEEAVYVNNPLYSKKKQRVDKRAFLATWESLGKQALSYTK